MKKKCLVCNKTLRRSEYKPTRDDYWANRKFCDTRCQRKFHYYKSDRRAALLSKPNFNDLVADLLAKDEARIYDKDYAITRTGEVYSRAQLGGQVGARPWRIMKLTTHSQGYKTVMLRRKGPVYGVHRLVMFVFVGRQRRGIQVRHLDGNPANNNLSNLRYGTPKENGEDTVRHGRSPRGQKQHLNKLTPEQVLEIRRLAESRVKPQRAIARQFGITQTTVRDVMTRKSWAWL
jgi:hypothetical protein